MADRRPLVSIVTSTYNRSNVLGYAIGTVLRQTLADWELIIIGDACTDDTPEVVASFGDERISFRNLPRNVGEQSGPNNEGVRCSRGRYIAFLNHDDLWMPNHLQSSLDELERTGADLVFSLLCVVNRNRPNALQCFTSTGLYEPARMAVPASTWFFRRELAQEVGPWRFFRECYKFPSQDWIYRAHKLGKLLALNPRLTVVAIHSGARQLSYLKRESDEHTTYYNLMVNDSEFLEKELTRMAMHYAISHPIEGVDRRFLPYAVRAVKNAAHVLLGPTGLRPGLIWSVLIRPRHYVRKGAMIDELRRIRGLPPLQNGDGDNS